MGNVEKPPNTPERNEVTTATNPVLARELSEDSSVPTEVLSIAIELKFDATSELCMVILTIALVMNEEDSDGTMVGPESLNGSDSIPEAERTVDGVCSCLAVFEWDRSML